VVFFPLCIVVAIAAHWFVGSWLLCLVMSAFAGSLFIVIANALRTGPVEPFLGVAIFFGGIYSAGISVVAGGIVRLGRSIWQGDNEEDAPPSIR
jgi:hypothetical protein